MKEKEVVFLIKVMNGGGAERVISILSEALVQRDFNVKLIITHQCRVDAKLDNISEDIEIIALEDEIKNNYKKIKKLKMLKARLIGKVNRVLGGNDDRYLIKKYEIRNYEKVVFLKKYFKNHKNNSIVSFLNDTIFLSLLSCNQSNRVIISERNDPRQCLSSKTSLAFFKNMYKKADYMIFQSPDAMKWYKENIGVKGKVIFNPLNPKLLQGYEGIRKKKIVNFCRISSQKNLELLVKAFALLNFDYPEYELYIYGDAVGNGAAGYLESIYSVVNSLSCNDKIYIKPAQSRIHNIIKDYAMFVSSSDYEGMSNSMLEAMAIGLPTICTDCPAGGARAIIKDHENGILVPVNDVEAMYRAMKEVIEDKELAEKISRNGTKLRDELSVDRIINQWLEIIE